MRRVRIRLNLVTHATILDLKTLSDLVDIFCDFSLSLVYELVHRLHNCLDLVKSSQNLATLIGKFVKRFRIYHWFDRMLRVQLCC